MLTASLALCRPPAVLLALIKPQFEAERHEIESGTGGESSGAGAGPLHAHALCSCSWVLHENRKRVGANQQVCLPCLHQAVVRDSSVHERVCAQVDSWLQAQGWIVKGLTKSPITGPNGNVEFIIWVGGKAYVRAVGCNYVSDYYGKTSMALCLSYLLDGTRSLPLIWMSSFLSS